MGKKKIADIATEEKGVLDSTLSRRGFISGLGLGAAALAGGLAGCAPQFESTTDAQGSTDADTGANTVVQGTQGSADADTGVNTVAQGKLNPQDYDYTSNSITDFKSSMLFSEWKLGPHTIKNRMVKSAACLYAFMKKNPDEYIGYYERLAKGGVGMIWLEGFAKVWSVAASGIATGPLDDFDIDGLLSRLHDAGAYVGFQFNLTPSELAPVNYTEPFIGKYSTEELKQWVVDIIGIGKTLKERGFDGFELNFAGTNFGQSFLSRERNNRTDEYGPQSIESRSRFAVEIIKGLRQACGEDFIIQVLFNGVEENDRLLGDSTVFNTVEDAKAFAKLFEEAGASSLHVRVGPTGMHAAQFLTDAYFLPRGLEGATGFGSTFDFSRHFQGKLRGNHSGCGILLDVAAEVKSAVSIPVGTVIYNDPAHAPDYFEAALQEGKVDFFLMTRGLWVDPEYVNKLSEGRIDEIAPCTRCLFCFMGDPVKEPDSMGSCRVNAANFRAYSDLMPEGWEPLPADTSKNVMVVGGGPAGMEAARVAAQRGHKVSLYEKNASLGGLLKIAESIKGPHENLGALITYLTKQQEINGVEVVTGTEVDAELIKQKAPDVVIIATGAIRPKSDLSSSGSTQVLTFAEAIGGDLGNNVVILGSNCQSVDICLYLLEQGKNVTIVTPDPIEIFEKGHSHYAQVFTKTAINARGTRIWSSASIKAIGDGEVTVSTEFGADVTVACDAIVNMSDMLPNTSLSDSLSGIDYIAVGDCKDPYNIAQAILAGNLAARSI